ncbi:unnamed protein product [Ixodes persulcatus]
MKSAQEQGYQCDNSPARLFRLLSRPQPCTCSINGIVGALLHFPRTQKYF